MDRFSLALLAAVAAFVTAGCAWFVPPPSHVRQHWGEAVTLDMAAMVENPEAGSSKPVEGLDPVTGELVAERYYQSEKQQQPREVRNILVE